MGVWTPGRKDQHLNYPPSRVLFPTMVTDRQPSGLPTEPRPMPGFSHQDELDPVETRPAGNVYHAESWSSGRLQAAAQRSYDNGAAHRRRTRRSRSHASSSTGRVDARRTCTTTPRTADTQYRTSERTGLHIRGRTQALMSTNKPSAKLHIAARLAQPCKEWWDCLRQRHPPWRRHALVPGALCAGT